MITMHDHLKAKGKPVEIEKNASLETARDAFGDMAPAVQKRMKKAAEAGMRLILPMEPRLMEGSGTLVFRMPTDARAKGPDGDVRDVILIRNSEDNWEIGLSCKHNHKALRHPRITEGKDFGMDWMGIHCSKEFMDEISPITDRLISNKKNKTVWGNIPGKYDNYYVPILQAYMDEIKRMCGRDPSVPGKLVAYFFGSKDFYKVIMSDREKTTYVTGFNMYGTLNKACGKKKAKWRVHKTEFPTMLNNSYFYKARTKAGARTSKTTIILDFDGGWSLKMRLHNKEKVASPTSLAWDVGLIGKPDSTQTYAGQWEED